MRSVALLSSRWSRSALCAGAALLVTTVTGAQGPPPASASSATARFSLSDAAALARRQHPLLTAAGGRRQTVAGAARQESAFPNPVFEWRKENYGSPLPRDEFISATLPVDLYGRRVALRSASGFAASRALSDSATTARQVMFDVARAYWRTALAVALRDAAAQQRAAIDTIAGIESERARQGAVPAGAALRARLEADRARLAESGARAELERARADLARTLAIPFDSVPQPTDPLRVEAASSVPSLGALLALARAQRSELLAARSRVDEATKRQLAERLGTLPALGVQVGSKRTSGFQTGTVQVGVAIPLFDRNGGNRERATGDLLMATGELRAAESAVDAEVTGALGAYNTLLAEYDRAVGVDSAGAGMRDLEARGASVATIAATAYREGAIQLFELLDAERVRADVRTAALRAAVDVHLARLDLLRAIGLPIDSARFLLPTQ
ncbi:MAG: TolC family protein [Gemmatimonadaceae bacterium]|nr:TolC family protein [Gemmatimonadaceae bacterium]